MKKTKKYRLFHRKRDWIITGLAIPFIAWIFCLPANLFDEPYSTVVWSSEGQLLGARIADDGQWRFPEVDSVPHRFEACIRYYEDEYFYYHPGVNPISTLEALWSNLTSDSRRGGSTITQQVMRLAHNNPPRTYWQKFIETIQAMRLELSYSKAEIMKLYASHAPFGGNVVGLAAAAWRYYGIPADRLSWGQSATLAVLPNAPALIYPGKNADALLDKRNTLLRKLYKNKVLDKTTYELAIAEPLPGEPLALPDIAPHFTERIRREYPGQRFISSIDYHLQKQVNTIVKNHYNTLKGNHIYNMAVLVLDVKSRQVIAYVGNTPTSLANDRYVDIIDRPRSTGSILKPFLYAAMLDEGMILPHTLVEDIPTNIDGYTPQNYNKKYHGAVHASEALIRSLNVPAVRMLQDYGLIKFYKILRKLKQSYIDQPAYYYGLSLILGGCESSLWDITNAYAGLASILIHYNNTSDAYYPEEFASPVYKQDSSLKYGEKQLSPAVFGAGAIYETLHTIKNLHRPTEEASWKMFTSSQAIAWKTGTSYGFKDAWAVGVTPDYAIGVWVGNADGEGRPGLVGIKAAAPVLFDVLKILPSSDWFLQPYDDMTEAQVCNESGHLAGPYCNHISMEWIPVRGLLSTTCTYHHAIFLNKTGQFRVNSSCYPLAQMRSEYWFSLPPIQEYYYKQEHPEYRPLPPFKSGCLQEGEQLMAFIYPKPHQAVILPKNFTGETNDVIFKLAHRGRETKVYWYLDEEYLGTTTTFHEISVQAEPGSYILTAIDQEGHELRELITIKKG